MVLIGLGLFFGAAFLVGTLAQKWKGRTGAAWFFLTLVLEFIFVMFAWMVQYPGDLAISSVDIILTSSLTAGALFGALPMLLIIATLPKRERAPQALIQPNIDTPSQPGEGMNQCPHCAEWIKAEAKICRYCGRDQPIEA